MKRYTDKQDFLHGSALRHGKEKPREPLRTVTELAEKLGITVNMLGRLLSQPGSPQPIINNRFTRCAKRATWYKPSEVMKWWASRKAEAAK